MLVEKSSDLFRLYQGQKERKKERGNKEEWEEEEKNLKGGMKEWGKREKNKSRRLQ